MRGMRRFASRSRRKGPWRLAGDVAMAVALLFLLALAAARMQGEPESLRGVATVHDGDTLSILDRRVRLLGIDAPELSQTCRRGEEVYPCGRHARDALRELLGDGGLVCDWSDRDRYGRLLAVCRAGETEVNAALVNAGWAVAYGAYEEMEARAKAERVGLWAGEFDSPRAWRERHGGLVEAEHVRGLFASILDWLRIR